MCIVVIECRPNSLVTLNVIIHLLGTRYGVCTQPGRGPKRDAASPTEGERRGEGQVHWYHRLPHGQLQVGYVMLCIYHRQFNAT